MRTLSWLMLLWTVPLVLACGCDGEDTPTEAAEEGSGDDASATRLRGTWVHEYALEPVVHELVLNPDGTLVHREFRQPPAGQTLPPEQLVETRHHRSFDVDLPLYDQGTGTWQVQNGEILYTMEVGDGDPLIFRRKIERIASSEFVESTTVGGQRQERRYQRPATFSAVRPRTGAEQP